MQIKELRLQMSDPFLCHRLQLGGGLLVPVIYARFSEAGARNGVSLFKVFRTEESGVTNQ